MRMGWYIQRTRDNKIVGPYPREDQAKKMCKLWGGRSGDRWKVIHRDIDKLGTKGL